MDPGAALCDSEAEPRRRIVCTCPVQRAVGGSDGCHTGVRLAGTRLWRRRTAARACLAARGCLARGLKPPSPVTVGATATGTVTAKDAAGNTAIGYTGTVHFSSSDPAGQLPADHTFAPADRGSYTFALKFGSAGTQRVVVADVAASSITGSEAVVVTLPAPSTLLDVANDGYGAGVTTSDIPPKSITVYAGVNPSPTATIAGSHTGMDGPQASPWTPRDGSTLLTCGGHNTIIVYAPGARTTSLQQPRSRAATPG